MPSFPLPSANRVFIVRLWLEAGDETSGQPGEWRGSVELLASEQRYYFRRLSDIGDIIAEQLKTIHSLSHPSKEEA